jgi:hypothetical protein
MTIQRLFLTGAALTVLASTLTFAEAPTAGTVHVRFNVAQPAGLKAPLTIAAQVYRVERDSFGHYKNEGQTQTIYEVLDPKDKSRKPVQLDTEIELGDDVEYEFRVVVLDDDGRERADGAYLFVRPTEAGELLDETIPLRPGQINELNLTLRWVDAGDFAKSNFMKVDQLAGESDYVLALYVIPSTNIKLFN